MLQWCAYGAFILQVGDVIVDFGPDLLTTCGNPANILSVNKTFIGVGGACSRYNDWTEYSHFASADLKLPTDNCTDESSATIVPLPSVVTLALLAAVSYFGKKFDSNISFVYSYNYCSNPGQRLMINYI